MIEGLPNYITIIFILTTILTVLLFLYAVQKSTYKRYTKAIGFGLMAWMILQMALSFQLFYLDTIKDMPPKFMLGFVPTFILMLILFNLKKGKAFIDALPLTQLTLISIVRIPVELVLYWLFLCNWVPELMTFSGVNFDILAGLTAPFVIYFAIKKNGLKRKLLLTWNVISMLLLLSIILNAVLSSQPFFSSKRLINPT